jgi:hypothetical protein
MTLLKSEWQSEKRPKAARVSSELYDSCVGQYQLSPDFAMGMLATRLLLRHAPKAVIYVPAGLCLIVLFIFLRRAATAPQAMDHPGLRGTGRLSSCGSASGGGESPALRAGPSHHRYSP